MNEKLNRVKALQELNIKSLRGMLKILKPIKADEASAVRLMLAQILQNESSAKEIINTITTNNKPIDDWEAVTGDIE